MNAAAPRDRLRIAVQKSGRLAEASQDLLARCGLKFRQSRDKLFCFGESLAIDLLLVRDDDIPGLIAQGVCDLGIVGRNVLNEQYGGTRRGGDCAHWVSDAADCPSRCRTKPPYDIAARSARSAHRHDLSALCSALAARTARRCADRGAVRIGGNRAATGHGRCDLRSGVQRRHARGQSVARSRDGSGKRSRAGRSGDSRRSTNAANCANCCCGASMASCRCANRNSCCCRRRATAVAIISASAARQASNRR